ncbi:MAG: hypothetical protein ACEPO2_13540 [Pelagibaca sp.]
METTPEKQFLLAANALYLNRVNFLLDLNRYDPETRRHKARLDREDYSSFQRLRDCISWPGLLDDRIEPPFQDLESRAARDKRLGDLIASPADIARVTFSEIPFSEDEKQRLLSAGLEAFDTLDTLTPIARQGPGQVIRTARDIVIERLTRGVAQAQAQAGVSWQEVAAQCPEWNLPKAKNGGAVREVVSRVMEGESPSAHDAARCIVERHGWAPRGKARAGMIIAYSDGAAIDALGRKARNILKELEKEGFFPN